MSSTNHPGHSPTRPDPEQFFRVDHLGADLRARAVRGGAVTLANQTAKFILLVGSTAILARILTPEDFGLIAMVLAIIGFIATFRDLGLAMATVQRADVNHQQISTLFWINFGLSVLIAVATATASSGVAWIYGEPRLVGITMVLAVTIVFSGLSVQHLALLKRQMRFGALAGIEITAIVASIAGAVSLGLTGAGYWSLVAMPVIREAFVALGVWLLCGWRPGRPVRHSGVRVMLSFGANLTGFNLVNYFARNLDKVLIGRYLGASPSGLYSKAYQLVLLPIQQINMPLTNVAVPALSRLQNQPERYRAYYRRGVLLTAAAGMPAVAFLFVCAEETILTVLGEQWTGAVEIFRALGPAAFIGTFNVATGWVYVSLGRTRRQFSWGIFGSALTALGFIIGLRWGAIGVAASFSISVVALKLPGLLYCFYGTPLRLGDVWIALWRPTAASLGAGVVIYLSESFVAFDAVPAMELVTDFFIYMVSYVLIWGLLPGGRRSARELMSMAKDLRASPAKPEQTTGAEDAQ